MTKTTEQLSFYEKFCQSKFKNGIDRQEAISKDWEKLTARVRELEEENELLKGRKNVELAANTDNAKSKQQRELAGPMEMGQLLAGSTHKTSGDLEIERTKPVTWIHKGGGFISDSRGKFIGCFSGDFRYRDRIICAINSESETSNQLAAEQFNNKLLREALEFLNARIVTMDLGGVVERALSLPASTEALDKYVAERVKKETTGHVEDIRFKNKEIEELRWIKMARFNNEDCWIYQGDGEDHLESLSCPVVVYPSVLIELTRQRDLAVEWLERCAAHVRPTATIFYEEIVEAINAIKESEAK